MSTLSAVNRTGDYQVFKAYESELIENGASGIRALASAGKKAFLTKAEITETSLGIGTTIDIAV